MSPNTPIKSPKKRLDVLLLEKGLVDSRAKAQALILRGLVKVKGRVVSKAGTQVSQDEPLELIEPARYVSRGGDKLEGALDSFVLSPEGRIGLDIGASTGGFTDCLLQRGASKVFAVDVGRGQLDHKLRQHPKVVAYEKTHILSLPAKNLNPTPNFVVMDVSFISIKKILPHARTLAETGSPFVVLVKPQFEADRKHLKKGVVRSVEIQEKIVAEMIQFCQENGFQVHGSSPSKLKGPKGNQEYFLYLQST